MNNDQTTKLNAKDFILGLQHMVAMFGATVLVPIITGLDVSVTLFCAGIGTLLFHLCTRGKVPVFLGSSFAFLGGFAAVAPKLADGSPNIEMLPYACGGVVVAGLIYIILSFIVKKIGVRKIRMILPAQVIGPMIMVIGLNLVPSSLGNASVNWLIAAVTLGSAILINIFGRGFIKQLNIILAVLIGFAVSAFFPGIVDFSNVASAPIAAVPAFTLPKFALGPILTIAPIVVAVFMEHIGDVTIVGQVVGSNFIEDPGLDRTLLGDGLATMVAGLIGGPANTTYGENTAVLAITKNFNPRNIRIAAIFAIVLSCISKFGAIINSIPVPVMGGISLMLYCMISYVGVQTIQKEKVAFNWKNIVVMVSILFLGLCNTYLHLNVAIPLSDAASFGGVSLAAVAGIFINILLNGVNSGAVLAEELN